MYANSLNKKIFIIKRGNFLIFKRSVVSITKILRAALLYKRVFRSFPVITIGICNFLAKGKQQKRRFIFFSILNSQLGEEKKKPSGFTQKL